LRTCLAALTPKKQDAVSQFLDKSNAEPHAVNDDELTIADFFPSRESSDVQLSKFNSLGDTFEHSELLLSALKTPAAKNITRVMDFFCGSSIPTLRILAADPAMRFLHVESIDYDADAIGISRHNAESLSLNNNYSFQVGDAVDILKSSVIHNDTLVAFNPPYVPQPPNIKDPKFATINGGTDGTKFLVPFMDYPYEKGTLLAMTWSSLSNPARIIKMIHDRFDVISVQSYETEFGIYTSSPEILPYLLEQRAKGLAYFQDKPNGRRSYTIIGAILRKK
jgi:methylase of polypeptide subunit release factors